MEFFVCIHCHFYQPPRENAWLEAVEAQDSASPYHDWNQRITAECYLPNGAARILDDQRRIAKIVNNYARISFNFGPTLLSWMAERAPQTYELVLQADRESQRIFSGHGSAIAQAYNHLILPLANLRDKRTQIAWGIQDFQHRFGRDPEGMWLPETAVDLETLELLSEFGIKFTILAPHQAGKMRTDKDREWINLNGQGNDSRRAYTCHLPSGRSVGLFFYDGAVSRAVAFEKLLFNGENLARRLTSRFDPEGDSAQLIHIATDGETYGHHHSHGDMALAFALNYIEQNKLARLTNYGEYFAQHPPSQDVEILERTSWSCMHGVARWESNCGCNSGVNQNWNQAWRRPLREALDWLRDELCALYETGAKELMKDPWSARDAYGRVVIDRSQETLEEFLDEHALQRLSDDEAVRALRLLEMQRHLMLMYTSCGWFFDEPTGPETVQVLQYAGRAVQLSEQLFGIGREEQFISRLESFVSNIREFGKGRKIYERFVRPAMFDLCRLAGHYVIRSLFDGYTDSTMYGYQVHVEHTHVREQKGNRLATGSARIVSRSTHGQLEFSFAVLYLADHRLIAGVHPYSHSETFHVFAEKISGTFAEGNVAACFRHIEQHFPGSLYSLRSLFRDEQQRILRQIIDSTLSHIDGVYGDLYAQHASLIRLLSELHTPTPTILRASADFVLGNAIERCLAAEELDKDRVRVLLQAARQDGVNLAGCAIENTLKRRLEAMLDRWARDPFDLDKVANLESLVALAKTLPFQLDLWQAQNIYCERMDVISREDIRYDDEWLAQFRKLGELLGIQVPKSLRAAVPVCDEAKPTGQADRLAIEEGTARNVIMMQSDPQMAEDYSS